MPCDERLKAMLEGLDVLAVAVDRAGCVTFANPRVCELTGVAAGDIIGMSWFDSFLPEPERELLRQRFAEVVMVPAATVRQETGLVASDGSVHRVNWSSSLLIGPDGSATGCVALGDDVTLSRQARALERRLSAALQQTAESVVITDTTGDILYVNPAFERISGYAAAEVTGRNPRVLQSGKQDERFYQDLWGHLVAGRTWQGELVNRARDGHLYVEQATITPVRDPSGEIVNFVAVKRDVSAERARAAEVAAANDERVQVARLLAAFEPLETPEATAAAIVEAVNALPDVAAAWLVTFEPDGSATVFAGTPGPWPAGHVGDAVPAARAAVLRQDAQVGAIVRPWLRQPGDPAFFDDAAATGITATASAPIGNGEVLGVLRVGATGPDAIAKLERHLPAIVNFAAASRSLLMPALRARQQLAESRAAMGGRIEADAFTPVFQPIVRLGTGAIAGFEALTQFDDGTRPDAVFGEAARVGLGHDLEVACLRAAVAASNELPAGGWLSLNASPRLILEDPRLPALLSERSRQVVIEITEHEPVHDYEALRSALIRLGSDLLVAVDDAGAGVANFSHLVELRPDFVKIDISLVRGVNADLTRQALIVGLHHFAQSTNRDVIAEGIESEAERRTLIGLGIEYGQGFLFGRPAPAASWSEHARRPRVTRIGDPRVATTA